MLCRLSVRVLFLRFASLSLRGVHLGRRKRARAHTQTHRHTNSISAKPGLGKLTNFVRCLFIQGIYSLCMYVYVYPLLCMYVCIYNLGGGRFNLSLTQVYKEEEGGYWYWRD